MSIIETYKDQFSIFSYDEDIPRSDRMADYLKKQGFQFQGFNSRGLFLETLKRNTPHIVILFYQPLNLKFRELLTKIRDCSAEIEVVLLGTNEFWPGVHSLIQSGLANDFWSWPAAGQEQLELRINQIIEKTIYKFIAEQRSEATAQIIKRLDEIKEQGLQVQGKDSELIDVTGLLAGDNRTEAQVIEQLIEGLKQNFASSEFVYFKNYRAKDQLLVTRTSFASQNYFRGQAIHFNQDSLDVDRNTTLNKLRDLIEETFACEEFVMQPVEFAGQFYGLLMAVNFDDIAYLQKTARYLSLNLRNYYLETAESAHQHENDYELGVSSSQFPLRVSTEVSRARRLQSPLSLIVTQLEYVSDEDQDFEKAYGLIKNNLRSYDLISRIGDQQIAILLPHCQYEDAAIKAETIRRQLVARGLKTQNTPLRLCFGVSEYPSLSQDSDALIEDAKKACAQVMVSGKNKVCLYSQSQGFEPEFQIER